MQTIPFTDVRAHLADTLRDLEGSNEPVFISRRGQPAAVLMSLSQYQRLAGAGTGFGAALQRWRDAYAAEMAEVPADFDPFANLRDSDPNGGREPLDWMEVLGAPAGTAEHPRSTAAPRKAAAKVTRRRRK
jgi:prevent-host-death family protein